MGSGVANTGLNYFRAGDIRLSVIGSFDQTKLAVNRAIRDLDFEVRQHFRQNDSNPPKHIWVVYDDVDRTGRLVLTQHTSRVGTIHIDINVLGKGANSQALAMLFVDRISRYAEAHSLQADEQVSPAGAGQGEGPGEG